MPHYKSQDQKLLKHLIINVVFPYKLPQSDKVKKSGSSRVVYENQFLKLALDSFNDLSLHTSFLDLSNELTENLRMIKSWNFLQSEEYLTCQSLNEHLFALKPGQHFPLYLRSQNACIYLSLLSPQSPYKAVISSFQVSIENSTIMEKNNDLATVYPSTSYFVKDLDVIHSSCFAKQLETLGNTELKDALDTSNKAGVSQTEIRKVIKPVYVTEWLTAMLSGSCNETDVVKGVNKKIRDDVMWKKALAPFRRSPMWICIKAIMHIFAENEYKGVYGKLIYKVFICNTVRVLCERSQKTKGEIRLQIIQKIARKVEKISRIKIEDEKIKDFVKNFFVRCEKSVKGIRETLDMEFKEVCNTSRNRGAGVDYSSLTVNDCEHKKLAFFEEIKRLRSLRSSNTSTSNIPPNKISRIKQDSKFPDFKQITNENEDAKRIMLYDIECWVRYELDSKIIKDEQLLNKLYDLLLGYNSIALPFYNNDPLGISRMTLTSIHLVCAMDKLVCLLDNILLSHKLGIESTIIQYLLLPRKSDIMYAYKLREYIDNRNQAIKNSVIDPDCKSPNSFASSYYDTCSGMKLIKKKIQVDAEQKVTNKLLEFNEACQRREDLINREEELECEFNTRQVAIRVHSKNCSTCRTPHQCFTPHDYEIENHTETYHSASCEKCKLNKLAHSIYIDINEWPLPTCANCYLNKNPALNPDRSIKNRCIKCRQLTKVVTFELMIPPTILVLRDSLHYLISTVLDRELDIGTKLIGLWRDSPHLKSYVKTVAKYSSLGSTTKLFTQAHYKNINLTEYTTIDEVFKPNGYNVDYSDLHNVITYKKNYSNYIDLCAFSIGIKYRNLNFATKWVDHTENQVISKQTLCPKDLNLSEFFRFGAFRAGGNLQMLNLLAAIESRGLSFSERSVYALICQSLWQNGDISSEAQTVDGFSYPDFHSDHCNPHYIEMFLKSIGDYIEMISANWSEHVSMLTIIVILCRMISMSASSEITAKFQILLLRCRNICIKWKNSIEELIESSKEKMTSKEIEELKNKLLEISCFGLVTFWTDRESLKLLLSTTEDALSWLKFISKVYELGAIFNNNLRSRDSLHKDLIPLIYYIYVEVEQKFHEVVRLTGGASFTLFVSENWESNAANISQPWVQYENSSYYFSHCNGSEGSALLQIGIDGLFLVNGKPTRKLPHDITSDSIYKNYFEDIDFDVTSDVNGSNGYSTKKINPTFSFCSIKSSCISKSPMNVKSGFSLGLLPSISSTVIIKEYKNNSKGETEEFQLIPSSIFINYFPEIFIINYSHWYNLKNNILEFRAKTFKAYSENSQSYFTLDLNSQKLFDSSKSKFLIDRNSRTFKILFDSVFKYLELEMHIHMFKLEGNEKNIYVELPRHGLKFDVDIMGRKIKSNEFNGMIISECQQMGTLLGLEHGLVLREEPIHTDIPVKSKFLIPSAKLIIEKGNLHQKVTANFTSLGKSNFFCYDFDDHLRILKAGESMTAWIYLAWLHACTSHILKDPFLMQTGTSRALEILQSPVCWSSKPLRDGPIIILNEIVKLSPKRSYYPEHMKEQQTVVWPKGIPSLCAQDTFQIICKKIITDSEKLNFVYSDKLPKEKFIENGSDKVLSSKAYFRFKIKENKLIGDFKKELKAKDPITDIFSYFGFDFSNKIIGVKKVIAECYLPNSINFNNYFMQSNELRGVTNNRLDTCYNTICDWVDIASDFKNQWLELYQMCFINSQTLKIKFNMLLSLLCFQGVDLDYVLFLQFVSRFQDRFVEVMPPNNESYSTLTETSFISYKVLSILNNEFTYQRNTFKLTFVVDRYYSKKTLNKKITAAFQVFKSGICQKYTKEIQSLWPSRSPVIHLPGEYFSWIRGASIQISELFKMWYMNLELKGFFEQLLAVYKRVYSIYNEPVKKISLKYAPNQPKKVHQVFCYKFCFLPELNDGRESEIFATGRLNSPKSDLRHLIAKISEQDIHSNSVFPLKSPPIDNTTDYLLRDLEKSWHEYKSLSSNGTQSLSDETKAINVLLTHRKFILKRITKITENLDRIFSPSSEEPSNSILAHADLWPSLRPRALLSLLLKSSNSKVNSSALDIIGALAVLWVYDQRVIRCITYAHIGNSMNVALLNEIKSNPHENFSPKQRPEWLIIELEMDIMIRPIQVKVAEQMMNPPGNMNSVMQLNMGEGKTSVIIPMLVSSIADTTKLVRVIVLRSLFNINYNSLVLKMGGLLNRRIHTFPCNRDIKFDKNNIEEFFIQYKECKANKGIVLTIPEHMLSFELKAVEKCSEKDLDIGKSLTNASLWIDRNARDILDESDEILNAKYQLVYSIGKQSEICGGSLRWEVAQAVLNLCKKHFKRLKKSYQDSVFYKKEDLLSYPQFRLLNDKAYRDLCESVCDDILKGKASDIYFAELRESEISVVKPYILENKVSNYTRNQVESLYKNDIKSLTIIQLLRGLFTYEVFYNVLCKRWRVEYGVNTKRKFLMQAVPFRAKDVPAERAQYEHPDIMIMLTQLSYYYSGLTDTQLLEVFNFLSDNKAGSQEYEKWIQYLPKKFEYDKSIKEFEGINLSDPIQVNHNLFPIMRKHPLVINFWLNTFLYSKEAKQFEGKLAKSAWDISKKKLHVLTGFSGTNESKMLLPLNAKYCGISELRYTNGFLVSNLLLPENNHYNHLPHNCNDNKIIEEISKDKDIKLLLDVGALMVSLDNVSVAKEWLNRCAESIEAAVYFQENDLYVIKREGYPLEFEMSTYKKQLEKCVIYLDDCHTRGTDLKIPAGVIGAVTLGKGVTKDKLMQACMRMRMLGQGHSVRFYASHEVHNQILKLKAEGESPESKIGSLEVIKWAISNSSTCVIDSFIYWAAQGLSFYYRQEIFKQFSFDSNYKNYAKRSIEHERLEIDQQYSGDRAKILITSIVSQKIQSISLNLNLLKLSSSNFPQDSSRIHDHLTKLVPNVERFSQLHDEEQEVELEIEIEQEQEAMVKRPKELDPLKPILSQITEHFVIKGEVYSKAKHIGLLRIYLGLNCGSFTALQEAAAWDPRLFVSKDYQDTVNEFNRGEDYLRPPQWFVVSKISDEILLISAYEANRLKMLFGKSTALVMVIKRSRPGQVQNFNLNGVGIKRELMAQVSVFVGSNYFDGEEEQEEYLKFIGYCPRERTEEQQRMFDEGLIEKNGFVVKAHREKVFGQACYTGFTKDPADAVIRLANVRGYWQVSKFSHHLSVLLKGQKPLQG